MAFDQKTRNLLQRTITACRRVFDREFTAQLQELYGIQPDGTLTQCEMLDHLADEELEVARLLRSRLNHLEGGEPSETLTRIRSKPENVARVIREQAFTVLNRLAALRLCEERGLVLECVRQGVNSEGFQLFMTTAGNALGETHEAYFVYLHCLFDELALDLGVLFDRFSPLALLFPRKDALEEVLRELNGTGKAAENEAISAEGFAEIWKADETIGWIYQYYNDEAERKKMREESSAPRNSRELAVRNQFFTPRYVVEFLADNTLGRLWYEMRHGETVLRDRCAFLVRRPTEIFLEPGEAVPERAAGNEASQEELLQQPVYIPHRPLKDPREIRLLDPACGSMHFGLYAFDLFTVIYDEAWEIAHGPDERAKSTVTFAAFVTFASNFSDKAAFLLQVPRLIIEHNIHGIDIDPRAAQIAGLSLWLRAQRAWHEAGIKPADRPRIIRSNIVCAEAMPGEKKLLREFVEQQFDIGERPAFAFLLEKIFDHMALAGEAGSLLRIEEEIRSAIDEASTIARSQPVLRQAALFPGDEKRKPKQLELQGLVAEHFWLKAEQRIYDALKTYAEEAESGSGFQRRLFADDAAQGFAFIDLCRKRYEVVVMNPPYGLASQGSDSWVREQYSRSCNDLYGAFSERAFGLTASCRGFVGALTSKTFLYSKQLHGFRDRLREDEHRLLLLIDLGAGVLDAAVETSSWVVGPKITPLTTFWDYTKEDKDTLSNRFLSLLYEPQCSLRRLLAIEQFDVLPFGVFSYWCPFEILRAVADLKPFEPEYGQAVQGLKTFDDFRFIRLCWELQYGDKLDGNWRYIAKGGGWSRYHSEAAVVMDWRSNGEIPRQNELRRYGTDARSKQSISFWGRRGLTFSEVSSLGFSAQPQQEGNLFGGCGFCIFVKEQESLAFWLAFFNSRPVFSLLSMFSTDRHWNAGMVARLPIPDLTGVFERLSSLGRDQFALARKDGESSETAIEFICPNFKEEIRSIGKFNENQTEIDAIVTTAYGFREESLVSLEVKYPIPSHRSEAAPILGIADLISYALGAAFGRWDIRFATGEKPAPELPEPFEPLSVCPPGMLQNGQGLPLTQGEVERLSAADQWCYPLKVPWDGILVDDPEDEMDIVRHVRESLNLIWRERAETIEQEASESLNASDIGEYFRKPVKFFADHQKRYSKNRRQAPIYWPLSTAGGRYTLWLYYHRLTPDTLYKCLQLFVVPKLADVEKELAHLRTILAENEGGANERNRLEELESLRSELIELRTELELWAPKWKPNLNDGVIITAAPLWRLFRLPKWQKDLKACWQELEKGDYDWAHLAYSLWPDRVREKCKTDRSLAIAHGLEEICEVKAPVKKLKKSKKTTMKDDLQEYFEG